MCHKHQRSRAHTDPWQLLPRVAVVRTVAAAGHRSDDTRPQWCMGSGRFQLKNASTPQLSQTFIMSKKNVYIYIYISVLLFFLIIWVDFFPRLLTRNKNVYLSSLPRSENRIAHDLAFRAWWLLGRFQHGKIELDVTLPPMIMVQWKLAP